MKRSLTPIARNLWVEGADSSTPPQLIGGRLANGKIVFPMPEGEAGKACEPVKLSSRGTLWSFTRQDFRPKSPYTGPEEFEPYLVGYVELPKQTIVETRLVGASLEKLTIGMPMELVIVSFDESRSLFAFQPETMSDEKDNG